MIIKHTPHATEAERIATENSNNLFLQELALAAQNAPAHLTEGTEFIFLGGDAEKSAHIDLVVDSTVSEDSTNPVQSQAVSKAIDEGIATVCPVGSLYWTATPDSPVDVFGGAWELIDKEFKPQDITSGFIANSDVVSSESITVSLAGHTVSVILKMINIIQISDTNDVLWGNIDLSAIGVSKLGQKIEALSINDGANGCVMFSIDTSGGVKSGDVIGTKPLPIAGSHNILNAIFTQAPSSMLDEFCEKFCWRRTS